MPFFPKAKDEWVRVARTRRAFELADQLRTFDWLVKTKQRTQEEIAPEYQMLVDQLKIENRIHAREFRGD